MGTSLQANDIRPGPTFHDKLFAMFSDFRRQPVVDFDLLKSTEMHDLPTDGDTVV